MPNHGVLLHYITGFGGLAGLAWLLRDGGHFLKNESGRGPSKPETFNRGAVHPNAVLTEIPSAETQPERRD